MSDNTYNGWTNYETWNYALWMDNDSGGYWEEVAQEVLGDAEADDTFSKEENAAFVLMDRLKEQCEADLEEFMAQQSGPFADILNAGVSRIDWYEIAKSLIEDL